MLRGRFGVLPRLGLTAGISFLVDTGADSTLLMPADARHMGVDYAKLTDQTESVGIGGTSLDFLEEATVAFLEPDRCLYLYYVDLRIAEPTTDILELPSLLGRNVLDRWRMAYDPGRDELMFRVRSFDQRIRLAR